MACKLFAVQRFQVRRAEGHLARVFCGSTSPFTEFDAKVCRSCILCEVRHKEHHLARNKDHRTRLAGTYKYQILLMP
jgi:hypothetical protein